MWISEKEHEKILKRVLTLLRERPRTVAEIALKVHCSRPAAYARLYELKALGHNVTSCEHIRQGSRGPQAQMFYVGKPTPKK